MFVIELLRQRKCVHMSAVRQLGEERERSSTQKARRTYSNMIPTRLAIYFWRRIFANQISELETRVNFMGVPTMFVERSEVESCGLNSSEQQYLVIL